jgi:hypothetical protein
MQYGKVLYTVPRIFCEFPAIGRSCMAAMDRHINISIGTKLMLGILASKAQRNRPLRRTKRMWENNIKMDLIKIACVGITGLKFFRTKSDDAVS